MTGRAEGHLLVGDGEIRRIRVIGADQARNVARRGCRSRRLPAIGFIVHVLSSQDELHSFHLRGDPAQATIWTIVAFAAAIRGCGFALFWASSAESTRHARVRTSLT